MAYCHSPLIWNPRAKFTLAIVQLKFLCTVCRAVVGEGHNQKRQPANLNKWNDHGDSSRSKCTVYKLFRLICSLIMGDMIDKWYWNSFKLNDFFFLLSGGKMWTCTHSGSFRNWKQFSCLQSGFFKCKRKRSFAIRKNTELVRVVLKCMALLFSVTVYVTSGLALLHEEGK